MADSRFERFSWKTLWPFGVELSGDLHEPLTEVEQCWLRDLFFNRELLVFRKQQLSHTRQTEVMESLGPVLRTSEFVHFISTDKNKGALGTQRLPFHSDLSYAEQLLAGISLHAVDVMDGQTSTLYVSSTLPVDKLPAMLRRRLEGLNALHVFPWAGYGTGHLESDPPDWAPRHVHPVLLPHPVTGRIVLYIDQMLTTRIECLPKVESRSLINELHAYLYAPDNMYEHVWHMGDLVIWDNIAVQHGRGDLLGKEGPRILQKVKLGDLPFEKQWPKCHTPEMQAALRSTAAGGH